MGASASSSSLHSGEATSKSKTEETSLLPNKNEHKKDQRDEPKDEPWFACDLAIIGPGLLVSLADTEFASLMEAANSGARFKFSFQMGLQLLLIPVLFLTQELTVRLGAHTQKGHGACIREVYGPAMSWFCFLILSITCILATMTELAGIVGVAEICGLDPTISVCVASLFMIILIFFCPYRVVEKVAVIFGSFELSFVVAAFLSRPRMDKFWPGLFSFDVPPELAPEFAQMAAANIGAVIVPWMIYFQQSAVAANGVMSGRAEAAERTGTLLGSTLTQIIMVATMVAFAATRDKQHGHLNSIDDANAMNQVMMELFGDLPGRVLCTLGIVGGSVCAAIVVALANSWALVDALGPDTTCIAGGAKAPALPGAGVTEARRPNPMDLSVCEAPFFYAMYAATVLIGFIIIMSGVSQEDISVAGLLTNALFMPPTLLFLWLLATGPKLPETTRVKGFYKWITAFAFCLACTFSTIELVLGMTDTPGSGLAAARARKRSHRSHVVLGSSISNVETRASKPHIIIMLADDLGYANVGWNNAAVHTPQLNALVADGVRLERHYVYQFCSPSRASLMTGRYPIHVQERMGPFWSTYTGPPTNMTLLPAKLREAQYRVHHVGKWHLGAYSNASIPVGRGFETSFGFLDGMQDHWNHRMQGCNSSGMEDPQGDSADLPGTQWECWGNALPLESCDELSCYANLSVRFDRDLWRDRAPATALDGVFSQDMYEAEARNLIASHDLASPLFLYLAFQLVHGPIQTPKRFVNLYDAATHPFLGLRKVWGFVTALDESIGRIVGSLKARPSMWENSVLIFSADNGGPLETMTNYPLRGGKFSDFEGGIRSAAFVSGGYLPAAMRGSTLDGYAMLADWYVTICGLASVDPTDERAAAAGLPPVDGLDLWPMLSGANRTSPRTELPISSATLIVGDWKLMTGTQGYNTWSPPVGWPADYYCDDRNASAKLECGEGGCLFNVRLDPSERHDLATKNASVLEAMQKRLEAMRATVWHNCDPPSKCAYVDPNDYCANTHSQWGDAYGPYWRGGGLHPFSGNYSLDPTGRRLILSARVESSRLGELG